MRPAVPYSKACLGSGIASRQMDMTSEEQLQALETRLVELIEISSRLRSENQALHNRESKLLEERAQLLKKNDMAKSRVEAIISRLRALEQEP